MCRNSSRPASSALGSKEPLRIKRSGYFSFVTHGVPGVRAAMAATHTIPIVMARIDDAEEHGFVASLARPGGNVTGLSIQTGELSGKWLKFLKEAVPSLSRVA